MDPRGVCGGLACNTTGSCYPGCASSAECIKGYYCNNSACLMQGAKGASCDPSNGGIDCQTGTCSAGTCT
jgi:hypothetical protein